MTVVKIIRVEKTSQYVKGALLIDGNFIMATLEPPDRANSKDESAIPLGQYVARPHVSPKHGQCFKLYGVNDRDEILIHKGNYPRDTKGCILVGSTISSDCVFQSRLAFEVLKARLKDEKEFYVLISECM